MFILTTPQVDNWYPHNSTPILNTRTLTTFLENHLVKKTNTNVLSVRIFSFLGRLMFCDIEVGDRDLASYMGSQEGGGVARDRNHKNLKKYSLSISKKNN